MVVYPNPVKDIVHFTVDNEIIKQVDVYDSCGKLIYSTLPYEKTITVSGLASGIYFLKVYTDTTIFNAKIVKE